MLRNWQSIVNAIVVVIAMAAAATWLSGPPRARPGSSVETVNARILASEISHVRGRGQLALIEFSDFECEYCSRHARTTAREIDEHLLKSGRIRHVFINFPLPTHRRAQKAGEAAECAAQQGRFWEMHDLLFDGSSALKLDDLMNRAGMLGLDAAAFTQCLEGGAKAADVKRDVETGRRLGVDTTPTFFVGTVERDGSIAVLRRIIGAAEYKQFEFAVTDLRALVASAASRGPVPD